MRKLSLVILILVSVLLFSSGCKKEEPPIKKLDYISNSGKTVYEFFYENGLIKKYTYRGVEDDQYDFTAHFENGKIHQYTYPHHATFAEFIYSKNNDTAWLVYDGIPDSVYAVYLLNSKGRVTNSTVYSENETTDLKFYYINGNVTKIDVIKHTSENSYGWYIRMEYDNNPNPWYDLNDLDDYRTFSKNNITNMNGKSYNSWEYDDTGYPVVLNSKNDGRFNYFYK